MAPMASIEDLLLIFKSKEKSFLREKGQNAILPGPRSWKIAQNLDR